MKYINTFKENEMISGVYLCKSKNSAVTKAGKDYDNVVWMNKTGSINGKIWEPSSPGIEDYEPGDYVMISGKTSLYNGSMQIVVDRTRVAEEGEYIVSDYVPSSSRDIDEMWDELMGFLKPIKNPYLQALRDEFFVKDKDFIKKFRESSAAKSLHHAFRGGLLEHSLSVTRLCDAYAKFYPMLNRDLLVLAASLHDMGKTRELSLFPTNDYTDEGQLLGHIVIGIEMATEKIALIPDFPEELAVEFKHLIAAHHGKLEFGSPKKPSLMEAYALSMADDMDAKLEGLKEECNKNPGKEWLGMVRMLDSNFKRTESWE